MTPRASTTAIRAAVTCLPPVVAILAGAITPAQADWIELADGQRWRGLVIEERDDGARVIEVALLGRITVPAEAVVRITPEHDDSSEPSAPGERAADLAPERPPGVAPGRAPGRGADPAPIAAPPPSAAPPPASTPAPPVPASPWSATIDIALDGAGGSTSSLGMRVGAGAVRRTEDTLLTLDTAYTYQSQHADTSDNRLTAGIRHDWLLPRLPWFFFADSRYDYDAILPWEHRLAAHGGGGVEITPTDAISLTLRGGVGARYDDAAPANWATEGLAGVALNWTLTPRQVIEAQMTAYPVLDDPSTWRTRSSGTWRYTLDERSSLSLVVGIEHEYDATPNDAPRNDIRGFAGVRLGF